MNDCNPVNRVAGRESGIFAMVGYQRSRIFAALQSGLLGLTGRSRSPAGAGHARDRDASSSPAWAEGRKPGPLVAGVFAVNDCNPVNRVAARESGIFVMVGHQRSRIFAALQSGLLGLTGLSRSPAGAGHARDRDAQFHDRSAAVPHKPQHTNAHAQPSRATTEPPGIEHRDSPAPPGWCTVSQM